MCENVFYARQDPDGNWTTRRPPDDCKETQTAVDMVMFPTPHPQKSSACSIITYQTTYYRFKKTNIGSMFSRLKQTNQRNSTPKSRQMLPVNFRIMCQHAMFIGCDLW